MADTQDITVAAFYKFADLQDYKDMRLTLLEKCLGGNILGTILLAKEGINGTIAGPQTGIDEVFAHLRNHPALGDLDYKRSVTDAPPFYRMKVRLKKEIVTMGVEAIDPNRVCGEKVGPERWNELISDPNVLVIDTRNDYEYAVGTFKNATNPKTETFREFPQYVEENLDPKEHDTVAMFCTGGIRCEKATAYMLQKGFKNVYHLSGGILQYLESTTPDESLWQGECFVFDGRVAVNQDLEPGKWIQCFACRNPVSPEDAKRDTYVPGISCPACVDQLSDDKKSALMERQKQSTLARERGKKHVGATLPRHRK